MNMKAILIINVVIAVAALSVLCGGLYVIGHFIVKFW